MGLNLKNHEAYHHREYWQGLCRLQIPRLHSLSFQAAHALNQGLLRVYMLRSGCQLCQINLSVAMGLDVGGECRLQTYASEETHCQLLVQLLRVHVAWLCRIAERHKGLLQFSFLRLAPGLHLQCTDCVDAVRRYQSQAHSFCCSCLLLHHMSTQRLVRRQGESPRLLCTVLLPQLPRRVLEVTLQTGVCKHFLT